MSLLFLLGIFAVYTKKKVMHESNSIIAIIAFIVSVVAFGSGIIYIIRWQIGADDAATQEYGISNFVWAASAFVVISGGLFMHILSKQSLINVQSINYFASFMIFEFCLMSTIAILINRARILNA
jgi:hypothetical protein